LQTSSAILTTIPNVGVGVGVGVALVPMVAEESDSDFGQGPIL
jgi:hypothetical protein